jgi:hypothetical protein
MFTIRCTAKLLARLRAEPSLYEVPPTTALGDWYATLIHAPRLQVVLFVSERTLRAMEQARIGKTASRRILGAMNDFIRMSKSYSWPPTSLTEVRRMSGEAIGPWLDADEAPPKSSRTRSAG